MNAYKKICKHITERIIAMLEKGVAPWRIPWKPGTSPRSGSTGKLYRGINLIILASYGFKNPVWFTFNQVRKLGGAVKKGEKSAPVVYWKWYEKKTGELDEEGNERKRSWGVPFSFNVFNVEQTEGLPEKWTVIDEEQVDDWNPVEEADKIVKGYKDAPEIIHHNQKKAFYRPTNDTVHVPTRDSFSTAEKYYSTLFHELGHSTGHDSRLGREGIVEFDHFGSMKYSREELIAEMTSAFLCGFAGMEMAELDNTTAYLKGWMSKLRNNEDWILWASSRAQKSSDHILGIEDGKMPEA